MASQKVVVTEGLSSTEHCRTGVVGRRATTMLSALLLLLQSALQPLVGFGLLYDFVPQSSIFTLLSPVSHFHLFKSSSTWSSHLNLGLPTGLDEYGSHSVNFLTVLVVSILIT